MKESSMYKSQNEFETRRSESAKILTKFPDRIPIILEIAPGKQMVPIIDKNKYLVPYDLSVAQFMLIIRKRLKLDEKIAIFLYIGRIIPPTSAIFSEIYHKHKDTDGFLYITYAGENTFG